MTTTERSFPIGLRGWAWTTLAATGLTSVIPIFADTDPIVAGGFSTVMMLLTMMVPLLWGTLDLSDRLRSGLVVGSATFIGGFFLLVAATVAFIKSSLGEIIELGPGIAPLVVTIVAACITVFVGLVHRNDDGGPRLGPGARWTGVAAGGLVTLGVMLPPPDSFTTFKDLNFSFDNDFLQFAWLVFLAVAGGAAAVGLSNGRKWGVGVAAAGSLPMAWILVNALFEFDRTTDQEIGFGGVLRQDVHPLLATAVFVIAIVLGTVGRRVAFAQVEQQPDGVAPDGATPEVCAAVNDSSPTSMARGGPPPTEEAQPATAERAAGADGFDIRSKHDEGRAAPIGESDRQPTISGLETAPLEDVTVRADGASFGPVVVIGGERRHVVLGTLVIGRQPTASESDEYPILVELGDADPKVSKTHLAIGLDPSGEVWAEDRHSRNGVLLAPPETTAFSLDPGHRTPILPNSVLMFGSTTAWLE